MLLGTFCVSSWIIGTCYRILLRTLATSSMSCSLRNLHDFPQFGCSEHLRLHLRIFTAFLWLLDLFLLHNWDFNYSFSELPQFSVLLASLALASRFQESQSKIECDSSSAFCTVRFGENSSCFCRSAVLVHLRRFSAPSALTSACSQSCRQLCRCIAACYFPRFFWTAWTVEICLCNTTGTAPCQCAASPGSQVCLANCLIFVWIWFPSLHLHHDALVFVHLQGVQDLQDQMTRRT